MRGKKMPKLQPPIREHCQRTFPFEVREIDDKQRRVHISFSSEKPVERFFGQEILCHDKDSVQLDRIQEIGVALFNHNRDFVIGVPEGITLNETERRCHAEIRFDDDEDGEKIFRKVKNGILRGVSVGYTVEEWEEVKAGAVSTNGRFKGPAFIATKWTPFEISIVSVPADSDVGVNREIEGGSRCEGGTDEIQPEHNGSAKQRKLKNGVPRPTLDESDCGALKKNTDNKNTKNNERENTMLKDLCRSLGLDYEGLKEKSFTDEEIRSMCDKVEQKRSKEKVENDKVDEGKREAELKEIREAEIQRSSEIVSLCRDFEVDSADYIKEGKSVEEVRSIILNKIKSERAAIAAGNVQIKGEAEQDKIRAAAVDGLLLRGSMIAEKDANESANEFRGMSMRDLAIDCLEREGVSKAHRLSDEELFKRAVTPDSQFAAIVDNTVKKSMATAYKAAEPTFDKWCGIGSNSDFKEAKHYQLSEAGELLPLSQNGEIKFDEMKDNGVGKKVLTYARGFGFTRQALINDDLGILTKVPAAYVRAALRGRNKLVYKVLAGNDNIYDGKKLFHADHNNLGTAGALSVTTVAEATKLMRKQKNLRGKETLNIKPEFLIVPAALEVKAGQLLVSTADPAGNNSGVANIYRNAFTLIVDAELDDYSETAYYFAANPADIDTIEVTYLNGNQQPILESQVGFDFLGIKWRIIDDFGVTALDYRGLAKNAGA